MIVGRYGSQHDSATRIPEKPQWLARLHRERDRQREAEEVCVRVKYEKQGGAKETAIHGNVCLDEVVVSGN